MYLNKYQENLHHNNKKQQKVYKYNIYRINSFINNINII